MKAVGGVACPGHFLLIWVRVGVVGGDGGRFLVYQAGGGLSLGIAACAVRAPTRPSPLPAPPPQHSCCPLEGLPISPLPSPSPAEIFV